MKLKRIYDPKSLADGAPRVTHHEVIHTGKTPEQNWDDAWVETGVAEGWITISGDQLALKTAGKPLQYTVTRGPGYFCKSSGESIPMSERAWLKFRLSNDCSESQPAARAWLAANGKEPNDYDISVAYHCVLSDDHHAKYRGVLNKGSLVAAHTLEG